MDRKLQEDREIQQLIRQGDAARGLLKSEVIALKQKLDFPAKIRGSLKSHPTGWLLGSLASGFIGSMLLRRRGNHPVKKQRGLVFSLLGLALTAARPLAKVWLADQVKNYFAGRPNSFSAIRLHRRTESQPPS
jgi:hypothetical protein